MQVQSLLDIPAGEGEFLETFARFFPRAKLAGVEPFASSRLQASNVIEKATAHQSRALAGESLYDLVTCLSGVMCFDGIDAIVEKIAISLKPDGVLIISNDNVLTIRDRLSFLFFGHVKRFKLFFAVNEGNWNLILPQGLWKICRSKGLSVEDVIYCSITPDDYLWLIFIPLFLPFYLFSLCRQGQHMSFLDKYRLFPLSSLFARHYYFVCRKK